MDAAMLNKKGFQLVIGDVSSKTFRMQVNLLHTCVSVYYIGKEYEK